MHTARFSTAILVLICPIASAGESQVPFPSGTEFIYSGTVLNSGVPASEERKIVFTTSTHTQNGTYEYNPAGASMGMLRHVSAFESGTFSEREVASFELSYGSATMGAYTSSGTYEGQDTSGPYSGTFTSSGSFQLKYPDLSRAPVLRDDFDDNSKDRLIWGEDSGSPTARFDEVNRRLEFRASELGLEERLRPLASGKPSYGENWEITVDLSNRFQPQSELPEAAIGLRIVSPMNTADYLETALLAFRDDSGTRNPAYSLLANRRENYAQIRSNFAALRVQFDSSKKLLHCDYDADGAVNGYSWTRFATYGINGSAGHTDDVDWGISGAGQEFGVFLYSYRRGGTDSDGLVSLDDFRSSVGRGKAVESLDEWLVRHYGSTEVPDAAPGFDRDYDGLTNLLEYAFGTDPKVFDITGTQTSTSGAPSVGIKRTEDFPQLEICYNRRKSGLPAGFTYRPQFSSTLTASWEDATRPETVREIGGGFVRVTVSDHLEGSSQSRFGRVRVDPGGGGNQ